MKLTREEALRLHRKMWTDMQTALGDNPSEEERYAFKKRWCLNHGFKILNSCFLCEYVMQTSSLVTDCKKCPFNWEYDGSSKYSCNCERGEVTWYESPISVILALPEREVEDEISDN